MSQLLEMVVVKGRTVVHNGKTYGQHSRISLPPDEAAHLEKMGFVLAVSVVQGLLRDPDGGAGTATSNDATQNTTGKNAKKSGA